MSQLSGKQMVDSFAALEKKRDTKFCPLLNSPCLKYKCEWWLIDCSAKTVAYNLHIGVRTR